MVDSIKRVPTAAQRDTEQKTTALRKSFETLSSGTSVSAVAKDASVVSVAVQKRTGSGEVGRLANNLNDAVRFSGEALKALQGVQESAEQLGESDVVQDFAQNLNELKSEIVQILEGLRNRADTASVLTENIEASDARVEDVAKAQEQADSARSIIQFNSEEALGAHSISADRVRQLLGDESA